MSALATRSWRIIFGLRFLWVGAILVATLLIVMPVLSAVDESVIFEDIKIPMRDGIRLQARLYKSRHLKGPTPVLLRRFPLDKKRYEPEAQRFAAAGYIAIIQDCRGRNGSEGVYGFYPAEGPDGFDTVEWIRRQPWCNGQVGMWGMSYAGSSQWLAAGEGAKLDATAYAQGASNSYNVEYFSGTFRLPAIRSGLRGALFGIPTELSESKEWPRWYLHLPLTEFDKAIGYSMPWRISILAHNRRDGFWKRMDVSGDIQQMNFPSQHIASYYDHICRETVRTFQAMRERSATEFSRRNQQLIIGPWDHGNLRRKVADVDFGSQATLDMVGENLNWFDRFLKKKSEVVKQSFPPVRYFMMGENVWKTSTHWPPPEAKSVSFYLRSGGQANTRNGDGRLDRKPARDQEPSDSFQADPSDPVPAAPAYGKQYREISGPTDQQLAQDRNDVLVYSTAPLSNPVSFAGPLTAELFVSADTVDADWVIRLIDVHPSGFAQPLATGIQRGSFRDSEVRLSLLEPSKTYRLQIDLGHAAARISAGHRLSLQIAGSCFPLFDRNTNTGEGPTGTRTRVATEQVLHSKTSASRVLLPVLPAGH